MTRGIEPAASGPASSAPEPFRAGAVAIHIVESEEAMGKLTAARVADQIRDAMTNGLSPVLWLMAAPSAFAFYRAFTEICRQDRVLASVVRDIPIYQFDDYPVARSDSRFPVTFRALLHEHLFLPLQSACGPLTGPRQLELTGTEKDSQIAAEYGREISHLLHDPGSRVIQVKGIGMDGHWGFHGAHTPLDAPPAIVKVPMGSQNVRQQRIDWPGLFPSDEAVPADAYSATVSLFMQADYVIDNVPQASKQYAVLACYGTDETVPAVPSSALKKHRNAEAVLTLAAAAALLDYREAKNAGVRGLPPRTLERLQALWDDPSNPDQAAKNRAVMMDVLEQTGIL